MLRVDKHHIMYDRSSQTISSWLSGLGMGDKSTSDRLIPCHRWIILFHNPDVQGALHHDRHTRLQEGDN